MASTNHTTNLNLNQWLATDPVIREDFNADNAKLDAAIAAKAKVVFGTYTGDNVTSQEISLGFRPKAVLITTRYGVTYNNGVTYGGLVLDGYPLMENSLSPGTAAEMTDTGFRVYYSSNTSQDCYQLNSSYIQYYYIALC